MFVFVCVFSVITETLTSTCLNLWQVSQVVFVLFSLNASHFISGQLTKFMLFMVNYEHYYSFSPCKINLKLILAQHKPGKMLETLESSWSVSAEWSEAALQDFQCVSETTQRPRLEWWWRIPGATALGVTVEAARSSIWHRCHTLILTLDLHWYTHTQIDNNTHTHTRT